MDVEEQGYGAILAREGPPVVPMEISRTEHLGKHRQYW
jgi:hypothetical protein